MSYSTCGPELFVTLDLLQCHVRFVIELVSCVHDFPKVSSFISDASSVCKYFPPTLKGLDLVSRIYDRAVAAQSGDLYPLLLSILAYIMEPYLR